MILSFEREKKLLLQGTSLLPREQSKLFHACEKVGRVLLYLQETMWIWPLKGKNQSLHELSRNLINGERFLPCVPPFTKIIAQRGVCTSSLPNVQAGLFLQLLCFWAEGLRPEGLPWVLAPPHQAEKEAKKEAASLV